MKGMIFVDLRLYEGSLTNEEWYFLMVNVTRGSINIRGARFSKVHKKKNPRSRESFAKYFIIRWPRATCTEANNIFDPWQMSYVD